MGVEGPLALSPIDNNPPLLLPKVNLLAGTFDEFEACAVVDANPNTGEGLSFSLLDVAFEDGAGAAKPNLIGPEGGFHSVGTAAVPPNVKVGTVTCGL